MYELKAVKNRLHFFEGFVSHVYTGDFFVQFLSTVRYIMLENLSIMLWSVTLKATALCLKLS